MNNLNVVGDEEARKRGIDTGSNQVALEFIGQTHNIEKAKVMMEYHIAHLEDVEKMLATRWKVRATNKDTYYPGGDCRRGGHIRRGRRRCAHS